jgi:hypothetical protein
VPIIFGVDHESKEVDAVAVGPVTYADVENHLLTERHFGGLAYKGFYRCPLCWCLIHARRNPGKSSRCSEGWDKSRNSAPRLSWFPTTLRSVSWPQLFTERIAGVTYQAGLVFICRPSCNSPLPTPSVCLLHLSRRGRRRKPHHLSSWGPAGWYEPPVRRRSIRVARKQFTSDRSLAFLTGPTLRLTTTRWKRIAIKRDKTQLTSALRGITFSSVSNRHEKPCSLLRLVPLRWLGLCVGWCSIFLWRVHAAEI